MGRNWLFTGEPASHQETRASRKAAFDLIPENVPAMLEALGARLRAARLRRRRRQEDVAGYGRLPPVGTGSYGESDVGSHSHL